MQHLEVSCAVRRLFKSLEFKGLNQAVAIYFILSLQIYKIHIRNLKNKCHKTNAILHTVIFTVFLLLLHRAQWLYRIENLHLPRNTATRAVLRTVTKETYSVVVSVCVP